MGININGLKLIANKIKGADILSLGYPDLVTSEVPYENPTFRNRLQQHGGDRCVDTDEFFEKMGAKSIRYIDVQSFHGKEDIVDLNFPHDLGKYDLVLDPGTLEHCWNVGQAWLNAVNAVRVGGHIYHNNPVTMLNHGFWNFSPTVYHDLYTQNGFDCEMYLETDSELFLATGFVKRFKFAGESMSQVIAKRNSDEPIKFPTQTKYL
jgi:hypothetical protein